MKKGVMAHWDEERDRRRIEQVRDIRYIPKDLIKRYELIGDIYDWAMGLIRQHCRRVTRDACGMYSQNDKREAERPR